MPKITPQEYSKLSDKASPPSPFFKNFFKAYLVGGLICTIGQVLILLYEYCGAPKELASAAASITLVFLSILLTALNLYDKIAKHAGAGTLVPITGFANAVSSPAIEFKSEGWVLGVGAKMFVIAGPVIVYGTVASIIYGLIIYLFKLF